MKKFPATHFVLAGLDTSASGEVRRRLEKLVIDLGLKDCFYFLGWADEAELTAHLEKLLPAKKET